MGRNPDNRHFPISPNSVIIRQTNLGLGGYKDALRGDRSDEDPRTGRLSQRAREERRRTVRELRALEIKLEQWDNEELEVVDRQLKQQEGYEGGRETFTRVSHMM